LAPDLARLLDDLLEAELELDREAVGLLEEFRREALGMTAVGERERAARMLNDKLSLIRTQATDHQD
jgi:hypothetical protein